MRGRVSSRPLSQPRISLRSIRATVPGARHHPVFTPAPGFAGRLLPSGSRRGVRNDWAKHRARGARMKGLRQTCHSSSRMPSLSPRLGMRAPICRFRNRHTGMVRREPNRPRNTGVACVPHAHGFCGLLHVPGRVASADTNPVRAMLSPGHALGPSTRVAVVCVRRVLKRSATSPHVPGPASWRTTASSSAL